MKPQKQTITELNNDIQHKSRRVAVEKPHEPKAWLAMVIAGLLFLVGGAGCALFVLLAPEEKLPDIEFPKIPSANQKIAYYSNLTGLEVTEQSEITAPAYCIQTPNGTDGARPQAGLNEAGVVFEAIAESGITRFAAIYQNPSSAVIGPIRSLRLYYLQWDTPFDCTIVHAGGADDALAAVRAGGYKDLTENYNYMYRGGYSSRLWNNLFTTSAYLAQMNADRGYGGSEIHGFKRMTPEGAAIARVDSTVAEKLIITKPAIANTSTMTPRVSEIAIRFGGWASFNVNYSYNATNNTYSRSYETGDAHDVYSCPAGDLGEVDPENACELVQLAPSAVAVMMVEERRAEDNYHEDITAIGSGTAYVFQNGVVVAGSWSKSSVEDQIKFYDGDGAEIALVPGQTFVEAVPNYGSVEY